MSDIFNPEEMSLHLKKIKSLKAKAYIQRDTVTIIADKLNEYFGSSKFLVVNLIFFILWILINTEILPIFPVFDPYPFIFLTMAVSLEAIFLAIFVLISQNRQTEIEDLREEVSLQISLREQEQNAKILRMLDDLHVLFKIKKKTDHELKSMEKLVDTDKLIKDLENEINENK